MWEIIADKPKQKSAPSFRRQVALRDLSAQISSKLPNPGDSNPKLIETYSTLHFQIRVDGSTHQWRKPSLQIFVDPG